MKPTAAMRGWLQPSLARRLVLALLVAFGLAWCALMVESYLNFRREVSDLHGLAAVAQVLAETLPAGDERTAVAIVQASESQFNAHRRRAPVPDPRDMLFRLDDLQGHTAHASPLLQGEPAPGGPGHATVRVAGRDYWSAVHEARGWRVQVLTPAIDDLAMVPFFNAELLRPMLIAFPFVLLPAWLAVRRGLRPLRELSHAVQARAPDDFSPLALRLRYAELQPLEAAFDALLERARLGLQREKGFVQDAAHELRTPLAVVAAQAHRLAHAGADERPAAQHALERAVARASHLVQQLLTLAALDGSGAGQARAVDLVEEARAILIAVAPRAGERGIEVSFESPDQLPARLDMAAFHSVLENLLNNACAYCPPGSRVVVALQGEGGRLRLTVADDGPGIAPRERQRVFERFYRGAGTAASGAGLGLSIVRQALDRLHGHIALGPGLDGAGVGFTVELPWQAGAAEAGARADGATAAAVAGPSGA
ncbi:sensor histidine kinase [Azohydromonas lata]|uniref:sensor histidine kinase n=1 Tax=Azohydromonas lata TaxID=45677 RepID=UPI0012F49F06|nr:HAMP domain-containing sensor histidine kinase [Azohydromonas lata]